MTVQKIITNTSYTYWLPCITEELLVLQMYHYHIACCSCQSKLKDTLLTCYSRYDHVTSFKHNLAGKEMLFVHRCPFFISQLHGIFSYDIYIYIKFLKSEANSTGGFVHNFHPLRHLNLNLISPRCIVFFFFSLLGLRA